jgi:hypothetical protein
LLDDFVFHGAISTRFSTELLKTFTQILCFPVREAMDWFQKCLAKFPQSFSGLTASFLSQKVIFPHRMRLRASCSPSRRLAIIPCQLQNVLNPNEIPDSERR